MAPLAWRVFVFGVPCSPFGNRRRRRHQHVAIHAHCKYLSLYHFFQLHLVYAEKHKNKTNFFRSLEVIDQDFYI